ncbi:hypothetical protein SRHO_G00255940 [Serrasalmus rhombeus]
MRRSVAYKFDNILGLDYYLSTRGKKFPFRSLLKIRARRRLWEAGGEAVLWEREKEMERHHLMRKQCKTSIIQPKLLRFRPWTLSHSAGNSPY